MFIIYIFIWIFELLLKLQGSNSITQKPPHIPYKRNIWRTLYLTNEGKNRIGERLNWRSTLSVYIANVKL